MKEREPNTKELPLHLVFDLGRLRPIQLRRSLETFLHEMLLACQSKNNCKAKHLCAKSLMIKSYTYLHAQSFRGQN